jgi:hypothetical protein
VFEELQMLCFTPKAAVAGEACGIGMGLVMLGTATKRGADMLTFARQIQHEKVIRSIGLGLGTTFPSFLFCFFSFFISSSLHLTCRLHDVRPAREGGYDDRVAID